MVTAILVILWLFRDFSMVYVLTQGGPVKATQTLSIMTYRRPSLSSVWASRRPSASSLWSFARSRDSYRAPDMRAPCIRVP